MQKNSQKIALMKYLWNVFENRNNEIHTNEICIRREPPVLKGRVKQMLKMALFKTKAIFFNKENSATFILNFF